MDAAVRQALQSNPGLQAVSEQVIAAESALDATEAASRPVVSLSHTARVSDNPLDAFADKLFTQQVTTADFDPARLNDPGSTDLWLTSLSLQWPVYTGGKLEGMQDKAGHELQQSRHQQQRSRIDVAYQTMQTYLMAIAASKAIDISADAVKAAAEHAATTTRLAKEERIVESDKLAAAVNLAAVRAQHEQSLTRLKRAISQLRLLMGQDDTADIDIDELWPPLSRSQTDLADLKQQALNQRDDLKVARSAAQAAEASVDVASAANKPSLSLIASSNWYDDEPGFDSQSGSLLAVASINLYDGSKQGKIGAARAQYKATQWQVQALEQSVQNDVQSAHDDLEEARKRFEIARDNVALAQKAVQQVQKRYGQGRTILLDLLQSERVYTGARVEKLTAELNIRINQLAVQYAAGTLALPSGGNE